MIQGTDGRRRISRHLHKLCSQYCILMTHPAAPPETAATLFFFAAAAAADFPLMRTHPRASRGFGPKPGAHYFPITDAHFDSAVKINLVECLHARICC
jgi:hypothetical protein